jgi:hypothetical protein
VAQEPYLEHLRKNPGSTLTLTQYINENLAALAPGVPSAVEEWRASSG